MISLLQPPPEVFDLFDDVLLLSEGQVGGGSFHQLGQKKAYSTNSGLVFYS